MKAFRIQKLKILHPKFARRNFFLSTAVNFCELEPPEPEKYHVWRSFNRISLQSLHQIIQKCAIERTIHQGKVCHAQIIKMGWISENVTSNILINAYAKCGWLADARKLFDEMCYRTLVSWNTIIGAYTQNGYAEEALILLKEMHRHGMSQFSEFTISGVLCACAAKLALIECKQLHAFATKVSLETNIYVGTSLVDVYGKCSLIEDAARVFECMTDRNDVTWTSMVVGFVKNELYEEAFVLFRRAQRAGLEYNQFTVSSVLSACAALAALIEGNQVHAVAWKHNFADNIYIASTLIDLYAKCGMIEDGYAIFSSTDEKNIVLWNAMVSGFARHGRSLEAMILFEKMQLTGLFPNQVTYISVLSACCHMGLVEEGRKYFDMITAEHNMSRNVFHYSIMVDILGRSGLVQEAKNLIDEMPFEATPSMWGSLLAACKVHKNVELAEVAAKHLFEMEPDNAGNHVLLSNAYASRRRWEDVALARKRLKDSKVKKERGKSWIEVQGQVHVFIAGERLHPRIAEVYTRLDGFVEEMKEQGYKGANEHELHDVDENRKQELLKHHSEKLAFIFGLMSLPSGVPIRIMKNLRICGDCHSFMKMASGISERQIIVRDNNRFHHFRNGVCSCGDFW
ncbi:OLC1v1026408C1 [Oldenlandia corymbosa var. corymbosa]|uniref:OLC1v1026408C1 n=1 Tax=Oldenlandia corymbosa var. corymbosa TaxID=529605 RepID=A0AAV1C7L3_OLDCO|nr:OLC1v1026408C1 [Oldenlandia corymbosa var. corymbosa]